MEKNKLSTSSEPDFTTKTWKEDFSFIVEDKRLYVARNIIALASPVFERIFEAEEEMVEMTLRGKNFEDVKEFLKCIYPSVKKTVAIDNAFQIFALADEYQVISIKAKCEACFLRSIRTGTSTKDLYRLINVACQYSLDELFHKCITLATEKSLSDLDEAENQIPVPSKAKSAIQRGIIKKMEATQANLNMELQKMTTLYHYHRAGNPKNEQLCSDDFEGWSGASLFAKIDATKYHDIKTFMLTIDGTQIHLQFRFTNRDFLLVISAPDNGVNESIIKFVGSVVVVNGLTGTDDFRKMINT